MSNIHPTALIDETVTLGQDVVIGPYCCLTGNVVLGDRVKLEAHVVITGDTHIGDDTHIYSFAAIGTAPQDLKFADEDVKLIIGARNKIREHVTMNPGTSGGGGVTHIGDDGLFMVGAHVAHDCQVGNNVIIANNSCLAGHVELGDFGIIGGLVGVHQFCRIGQHAFIGFGAMIDEDVIPYGTAKGNRAEISGLNLIGLKRHGFARAEINDLRAAYKSVFLSSDGDLMTRVQNIAAAYPHAPLVQNVVAFMQADNSRGFSLPSST